MAIRRRMKGGVFRHRSVTTWGGLTAMGLAFLFACDPVANLGSGGDGQGDDSIPLPGESPLPEGFDSSAGPPNVQHPDFGPTITQANAPPALGGASLIVSRDGTLAIATDPDRDRIVLANLVTKAAQSIPLHAGDEPSRLVEDANHHVHVVLRRAGAIASFDLSAPSIAVTRRSAACASPQGIALSVNAAALYVACSSGELVTLPTAYDPAPATPESATLLARLDRDLRDVVTVTDGLMISRLRSAEVLHVSTSGTIRDRFVPKSTFFTGGSLEGGRELVPFVAWRMIASKAGTGVTVLHQRAQKAPVEVETPSAYGGGGGVGCGGIVNTATTSIELEGTSPVVKSNALIHNAVAPVDFARSPDGTRYAIIAAGNAHTKGFTQVNMVSSAFNDRDGCEVTPTTTDPPGQAVAVAFTPANVAVVFTREPAAIHVERDTVSWSTISAGGESREDTGQAIFHSNAGAGMACVSCHPEAGDDGRVWDLSTGSRRTQSLKGTIAGTAPYHWGGDAPNMNTFASVVFKGRMSGQDLSFEQVGALRTWLEHVPAAPSSAASDSAAAARGKTLFESKTVGCTGCHNGPMLTNNDTVDVSTGGSFQVPSLIGVVHRAPYLHDGCVKSLSDRFTNPCAGGDSHGNTSQLTKADIADLVAFLETL